MSLIAKSLASIADFQFVCKVIGFKLVSEISDKAEAVLSNIIFSSFILLMVIKLLI